MELVPISDDRSIHLHQEAIARLEQAEQALARAESLEDVKGLRDIAAAVTVLSRERDLGLEIQNKASALKLKAEHKIGRLLKEVERQELGRPRKGSNEEPFFPLPTLGDMKISKAASHRFQQMAALPESVIEEKVQDALARGDVVSQRDILQEAKRRYRPEPKPSPPLPQGVFDVILADPPWKYDFSLVDAWAIENHYTTLTPEEMSLLQIHGETVASKFASDAILFLWVPAPKLPQGLWLMEAWQFIYKTSAFWAKNNPGAGMGWYFRVDHEVLLVGTRGRWSPPPPERRFSSLIEEKKGRHSAKPRTAREMIEAMYPDARRLELFAREASPNWAAWGAEAPAIP